MHTKHFRRLLLFALAVSLSLFIVSVWVAQATNKQPLMTMTQYRLLRPPAYANSPYWSPEFVREVDNVHASLDGDYWKLDDLHGKYYTIESGIRRTVGQPARFTHTLWLCGNSAVFDPYVPDAYTMASQLQSLVPRGWRVVNLGVGGQPSSNELAWLKTQPVKAGDMVVLVDGTSDVLANVASDHYRAVVRETRQWVTVHNMRFYHFMQAIQDNRFDVQFAAMSAGAPRLYAPNETFIDWAHTNEIGAGIIARQIADMIAPTF